MAAVTAAPPVQFTDDQVAGLKSIITSVGLQLAGDKSALKMSVRVYVVFKHLDQLHNGGHEIVTINGNSEYGPLCGELKTRFVDIYNGDGKDRSNISCGYPWSNTTSILRVVAAKGQSTTGNWDNASATTMLDNDNATILTQHNCRAVLRNVYEQRGHDCLVIMAEPNY